MYKVRPNDFHTCALHIIRNEKKKFLTCLAFIIISKKINAVVPLRRTLLHVAASQADSFFIKVLVNSGAQLNIPNQNGKLPFHIALIEDKEDNALLLMEYMQDFDFLENNADLALYFAACHDHVRVAEKLVERGVDLNQKNDMEERTPVLTAAANNSKSVLKLLLEKGADPNIVDRKGMGLLHHAVRGDVELIDIILPFYSDVNTQTKDGATPLLLACLRDDYEMAEKLINIGASVDIVITLGMTVLHYITKFYLKRSHKILYLCLGKTQNINAVDDEGRSILYNSIEHVNEDAANLIIDAGADCTSQTNKRKETLVELALNANMSSLAIKLFINGGEMNNRRVFGNSDNCFNILSRRLYYNPLKVFFTLKRDIGFLDIASAFITMGSYPSYEIVALFVAMGVDIGNFLHRFTTICWSARLRAKTQEDCEVVKLLLSIGVCPNSIAKLDSAIEYDEQQASFRDMKTIIESVPLPLQTLCLIQINLSSIREDILKTKDDLYNLRAENQNLKKLASLSLSPNEHLRSWETC